MQSPDKEVLKGMLVDRWMEDLRQDRAPSILPEMQELSQQEIAETLALARWLGAVDPVSVQSAEVDSVAAAVRARVRRDDEQQGQALEDAIEQATSFGGLLAVVRRVRQVKAVDIERALRLPNGTLENLESSTVPPHRIPIDTMLALLRSLHVATSEVVELIRQAGIEWVSRVYNQPATQLGRIDSQFVDMRHHLLTEATAQEDQRAQLAEELDRLEQYCRSLAARLG